MTPRPYIPAKTRAELASPAPVGQRHEQIKRVVIPLLANGLSADAVFMQCRGMYDTTVTDKEIMGWICWASGKNLTPCVPRSRPRWTSPPTRPAPTKPIDPVANITKFLAGFTVNEADLWHESPWRPLEDWRFDSLQFLAGMYHGGERVNIITDYTVDPKAKAQPVGYGMTLERDAAMRYIRDHGTPQDAGGAWVRMNPVDGKGVSDANMTAFRFALVEFDDMPVELQLSLLAKLPLPVNAIILSGGRSAHAWIRVNAPNADSYRKTVATMLDLLKHFGVCTANKNPSRLARLPGAVRKTGATGDGQQRLLYLAPDRVDSQPIFRG